MLHNDCEQSLGDRMKTYERVTRHTLIRRMPVIVRVDGKSFHSWTKNLPDRDHIFSQILHNMIRQAACQLIKEMQGAEFAYFQSDEISILLKDWNNLNTEAWFGNNIQKITSISASIATAAFNDYFIKSCPLAYFDARVFNLPKEEVVNYFIWRQQDATRNSIQMVGQHYFSHQELHKKSCNEIQEMLHDQYGINWNDYKEREKRGTVVWKDKYNYKGVYTDYFIPIFSQDRKYLEDAL